MKFIDKLSNSWKNANSLLCIGIDPNPQYLPKHLSKSNEPFFDFAKEIIDRTHDVVCAFKFQMACYSAVGKESELRKSISYLQQHFPTIPIILDAKRGDIGISAEHYATEAFVRYKADAVTVNPYLGFDGVQPFLNYQDKGIIILCKTSNPGSKDFQDLVYGDTALYEQIAVKACTQWNQHQNCLLVVGGTWPEQLAKLRSKYQTVPFLVPGLGAQGANLKKLVTAGINSAGTGLIISTSRHIIYAGSGTDFASQSRKEAILINNKINMFRQPNNKMV